MGNVIDLADWRTDGSIAPSRRVIDPIARAPIGASVEDLAASIDSAVRIPGVPAQASVMRRHLRTIAGVQRREIPIIETLTSELFNNAINHSRSGLPGGEVTIVMIKLPGRIQVKVIDQGPRSISPSAPQVREQEFDEDGLLVSEGGFGLRLVDDDASRWGVITGSDRTTTTVWFEVERVNNAVRA